MVRKHTGSVYETSKPAQTSTFLFCSSICGAIIKANFCMRIKPHLNCGKGGLAQYKVSRYAQWNIITFYHYNSESNQKWWHLLIPYNLMSKIRCMFFIKWLHLQKWTIMLHGPQVISSYKLYTNCHNNVAAFGFNTPLVQNVNLCCEKCTMLMVSLLLLRFIS